MEKTTHRGWHEGTRYRRKDGLYVGRVRYDGRRYQITSADAKERDRLLRGLIRGLERGEEPSNTARRRTLAQIVADWLADRAISRPATYPTWRSYARHLTASPLARQRVGSLTTAAVIAFYRERLDAGYAPSTVRQMHRTLRACLNWAVGQDVPVPAPLLKMAAPAVADVDRVQLSPAQVARLFRSLRARGDELEALWRLMWYASARLGELLALCWHDCGRGGRDEVLIGRVLVRVRAGHPVTRAGKTKESRSALAVPPDATEALRRHWTTQEARRAAAAAWIEPAIGRLVFDRGDGGALRHEQAEQAFYAALEAAGLPRCRPHDLRGASLSALREAGHDVLDVQRRARHARVSTTIQSYVRATDDADRRAAETLERLVTGA